MLDFAGGTVVHISSGVAGLVAAVCLGKRVEFGSQSIRAHSVPLVLLGTALLWFGWFGFNAGSALGEIGTIVLIKLVDTVMGFRVTREEEVIGLDSVLHNESAYPETLSTDEVSGILNDRKIGTYI